MAPQSGVRKQVRPGTPPTQPSHDDDRASPEVRWMFGPFHVWESQRRIERLGEAVHLGARTFDMLLLFLKRAGELIAKQEILAAVWPDVVVEEASVRVHMSLLRRALGSPGEEDGCREWITTIPQRGYRFNGQVRMASPGIAAALEIPGAPFARVPLRLTELVGRSAEVEGVLQAIDAQRLVTVVGTGGIGKTSVAIRVAERIQEAGKAAVAFVDLAPLISRTIVPTTIARALGVAGDSPDLLDAMAKRLADGEVVLLVDNCEHLIEAVMQPLSALLRNVPDLKVLATSREPLGASGEYVIRLNPLPVPDSEQVTLVESISWPSVKLLVDRAKAAGAPAFVEADGSRLAGICRHLDGIPLALELVGARLGVQAVSDLAQRLEGHMRVLSIGARSAEERHRTLAATLDWSVDLLGPEELALFRRLSVFRGRFDVASALSVAAGDLDHEQAFDALISLVNKSLVSFDSTDDAAPYRLLETTRSYAADLLSRSGEREAVFRRYSGFMLQAMKDATSELSRLEEQEWGAKYVRMLDDVRFAIRMALGEFDDAKTGASIVMASAPLWFHVSQVAEFRDSVSTTLGFIGQLPESRHKTEVETWLTTWLIVALLHTDWASPELGAVCDRAVAGALAVQIPELEIRARWGQCVNDIFRGEYTAALEQSRALVLAAESWAEPTGLNLAHRVSAMANHFSGAFEEAEEHFHRALDTIRGGSRLRANMVGVDPAIATMALQSRTLWIVGDTSEAMDVATEAVDRAHSIGHSVSLCSALFGACPVALWSEDMDTAREWIREMVDESRRRGLVGWLRFASWFSQGLNLGEPTSRDGEMRSIQAARTTYDAPHLEMLATFSPSVVSAGMLRRAAAGEGMWCAPEVWRAAGWQHEQRGDGREAEANYRKALECARTLRARSWELRAVASLAGLLVAQRRESEARELLDLSCDGGGPERANPGLRRVLALREGLALGSRSS